MKKDILKELLPQWRLQGGTVPSISREKIKIVIHLTQNKLILCHILDGSFTLTIEFDDLQMVNESDICQDCLRRSINILNMNANRNKAEHIKIQEHEKRRISI